MVQTATVATDFKGDGDLALTQAQAVVGGANIDQNAEGGTDGDCVPWNSWGPQETAVLEYTQVGERFSLQGERMATIEHRICIRDYNPYRIRQAKASMVAKGLGGHGSGNLKRMNLKGRGMRTRVTRSIPAELPKEARYREEIGSRKT
jgi:hypothetical protein